MVIIHPFHRILEDARHCSALSYRQVADRDYQVPEVIDRHSYTLRPYTSRAGVKPTHPLLWHQRCFPMGASSLWDSQVE